MVTVCAAEKNACYYRCPYDGGALFVQVNELPDEVFAPMPLDVLVKQFMEVLGAFYCDHKLLAAGMLYMNGYNFNVEPNRITAEKNGLLFNIAFEQAGGLYRTTNISLG